jgi:hypothetical protein
MSGEANKSADNKTRSEKKGKPRMSDNPISQSRNGARIRGLLAAALLFGFALGTASAQSRDSDKKDEKQIPVSLLPGPATPAAITPPVGNSAFLAGRGVGTQGYVCLPAGPGAASWTVNPARPEATLFINLFGEAFQITTHFFSPVQNPNKFATSPLAVGNATWQSSFDSSKVWAQTDKEHTIAAGTDPVSCPHSGSIACLLPQVIGSELGPAGGKALTKTTFIQRLNTYGGSAPATGCAVPGDVGRQALVPYSADYFFFRAD